MWPLQYRLESLNRICLTPISGEQKSIFRFVFFVFLEVIVGRTESVTVQTSQTDRKCLIDLVEVRGSFSGFLGFPCCNIFSNIRPESGLTRSFLLLRPDSVRRHFGWVFSLFSPVELPMYWQVLFYPLNFEVDELENDRTKSNKRYLA